MAPNNPPNTAPAIVAEYGGWCLSCGEYIEPGEKVHWLKGIGIWHEEDEPPRSLGVYQKDAEERNGGFGE